MNQPTAVRSARPSDADAIARIYNHYIAETIVTFEVDEVSPQEMARRVEDSPVGIIPLVGRRTRRPDPRLRLRSEMASTRCLPFFGGDDRVPRAGSHG